MLDYALELLAERAGGLPVRARVSFPPEFAGFQGHFPGMPIVPGFCQVQAVLDGLEAAGIRGKLERIDEAKFLRPIGPNESIELTIQNEADGGWQAQLTVGAGVASRLKFHLAVDD